MSNDQFSLSVTINIDTDAMVAFYNKASSWGSPSFPFPANAFCTVDVVPPLTSQIPNNLKTPNLVHLAANTSYKFNLCPTNTNTNYPIVKDAATIVLSMIRDEFSELSDWQEIFSNISDNKINVKGELIVEMNDLSSTLNTETENNFTQIYNLQYPITFQIAEGKGSTTPKYVAIIDPLIANYTDAPDN